MLSIQYPAHQVHISLVKSWVLRDEEVAECSNHYILKWKTVTLLKALHDTNSPILHDGILYLPIFFKCMPLDLINYTEVFLSFRKHKNALSGYVLISPCYAAKRSLQSS